MKGNHYDGTSFTLIFITFYTCSAVNMTLKVVELEDEGYPNNLKAPLLISVEKVAIPVGWLRVPNSFMYVLVPSWITLIVVIL